MGASMGATMVYVRMIYLLTRKHVTITRRARKARPVSVDTGLVVLEDVVIVLIVMVNTVHVVWTGK